MCDRCGEGFTFFGLAEPQATLIDAYSAALRNGWAPEGSESVPELQAAIGVDAEAFLSKRHDTHGNSVADNGAHARQFRLIRWLWDGDFCGEAQLSYDSGAPETGQIELRASIVPWKDALGYRQRAFRHLLSEARELGVPVAELDHASALFDARGRRNTKS